MAACVSCGHDPVGGHGACRNCGFCPCCKQRGVYDPVDRTPSPLVVLDPLDTLPPSWTTGTLAALGGTH